MIEQVSFTVLNQEELVDANGGSITVATVIRALTILGGIIAAGVGAYNMAKAYAYQKKSAAYAKNCYDGNCNGKCK